MPARWVGMSLRRGVLAALLLLAFAPAAHAAAPFTPGAPGIGDPYFPTDGNGGYDVRSYLLDLDYTPGANQLVGRVVITANATQDLSSFDLDLDGLTVRSVKVNGRAAAFTRDGGELVITPKAGLRNGRDFVTTVRYDGSPQPLGDSEIGISGFVPTEDGVVIAGQPEGAATWFPSNDHPADKASYLFRVSVPAGLQVVANGHLRGRHTEGGKSIWTWDAPDPMASYLATVDVGHFTLDTFRKNGLQFTNAIDPSLFAKVGAHGGTKYAISQKDDISYKRLGRTIKVPAAGSQLSFWMARDTEPNYDFVMVEAHTPGKDDWTTLPDLNGHTSTDTGGFCNYALPLNPFLEHYVTATADGCDPKGTTGSFNAASGASDGYENWKVDLSAWKGKSVELAITVVSDDIYTYRGAFVDDITLTNGAQGATTFESGANGWTVLGPPADSAPNDNDWIVGGVADEPETTGDIVKRSLDRQPEIIQFLQGFFGRYPFKDAGGIVDNTPELNFALETQTRPVYSPAFFVDDINGDSVVVHETAHQWTGDSLGLFRWKDIWLNEGFATYTEWLWAEHIGGPTTEETFQQNAAFIPADDPFWSLTIGDPGPDLLFEQPVYVRGAMTLQALRDKIGDGPFSRLVRQWVSRHRNGLVETPQFIALAESISHQDLGAFFDEWLYTPAKPASLGDDPALLVKRAPAAPPKPGPRK